MERLPRALLRLVRSLGFILTLVLGISAVGLLASPGRIRAVSGRVSVLPLLPIIHVTGPEDEFLVMSRGPRGVAVRFPRPGSVRLQLSLWGWLQLRPLVVDVVPPLHLVPGGQAIGVMLAPRGVLVERTVPVRDGGGRVRYPAREAGIEPGDVIVAADGRPVTAPEELARLIGHAAASRRPVRITFVRDRHRQETSLLPAPVAPSRAGGGEEGRSRWSHAAGLLVRDPAVGVGTLTFYDPRSGRFGALGHMVMEASRRPAPMPEGRIVRASIASIAAAGRGQPGEKVGVFRHQDGELGIIERNTPVGIFGRLLESPPPGSYRSSLPVALERQVKEGPAVGLTVLEGEEVEPFSMEILRVRSLGVPESQRLVVKVTDPRVLSRAGGIVQGMSGSPIIQDGHLVGAITHVAVQDPSRGFGVLIEPMVEASGLWGSGAGARAMVTNTDRAA